MFSVRLMVSGSVHAVWCCESVCQANEVLLIGFQTPPHLSLSCSNDVISDSKVIDGMVRQGCRSVLE